MLSSLSWKIWLREYQRQLINNNNSVRSCLVPAMFNLWRHWMTHLYFTFIRSKYVKDGGIWQALLFWEKKNCDTIHSYHSWKRRLAEYTTPWVNFINILRFFLYESASHRFSLFTFWLRDFLSQKYWWKKCK
jgi:hypothetical protein